MLKNTMLGILAGIMVSIGGTVLLSCENSVVGAVLFAVALLVICLQGYSLFTGKVGFIIASHGKQDIIDLISALFGNLIGTLVTGAAINYALPDRAGKALTMCTAKLDTPLGIVLVKAIFCGILMYTAVIIWRENKSISGIIYCIPVFILSGFEHSIADMFYFFAAAEYSFDAVLFIVIVVIGNSIGGMLFPFVRIISGLGGQKQ